MASENFRKKHKHIFLAPEDEAGLEAAIYDAWPGVRLIDTATHYGKIVPEINAPLDGKVAGIWNPDIFPTLAVRTREDGSSWTDDPHSLILWGGCRPKSTDGIRVGWWSTFPSLGSAQAEVDFRIFVDSCWRIMMRLTHGGVVAHTKSGIKELGRYRIGEVARERALAGELALWDMRARLEAS
ncbi:hypothetical protein GCM10009751_05940 [Myceligenerans crystallogenes]|uniref:Uncharacterized protein n=2 Tax=Myceligenerans crystallogenes TaxID=316335 RepID=A0ABN2N5F3_9MICO